MTSRLTFWREVSLGDICEFRYGKSLPESKRIGSKVPVYGSNGVVGSHVEAITQGPTIVVGRKGSFGEVHFSTVPCWPIDTTYYIDASATQADLRWLTYRLSGLGLTQLNRAAAVPGLNREDAYRKRLLLPPPAEQRRIAEVLDRAEALRAKRRAALAQLDSLTQSLFLDLFGDPATNSKRWPDTKTLGEVADMVSGVTKGRSLDGRVSRPVPYLAVANVQDRALDLSAVKTIAPMESRRINDSGTPGKGTKRSCRPEGERPANLAMPWILVPLFKTTRIHGWMSRLKAQSHTSG